jgi:ArsR family transcriptional regulator
MFLSIEYADYTAMFKALADENRLKVIDMLSCGETCACDLLDELEITQATLSHHMKVLCENGLIENRKDGKWMYYSLNDVKIKKVIEFIKMITTEKENCICKKKGK